uniref:Allophycocyanin beta 18 subunit n=1 Tax=Polysiphonia sertularioides TaxID=945028 RepID=A0A1Z1M973_9FLOR|nr:allophycocyanin beta 18 subunit [Polysiphonia sertularioides]ARW62452.1 allophycocyanin beta 18 subunit [Polysiphonia sertularioides]
MQDAISSILNKYDTTGKYLDKNAIEEIEEYFVTAKDRIKISELIISNSSKIVKEAATRLYLEQPELLRPGGNSYTTRRYATCLRDIDYYLRYASYSLIAANNDILNERLLDGLKETYSSLSVPVGPIIRVIEILKDIILIESEKINIDNQTIISLPFDHINSSLSEQNI